MFKSILIANRGEIACRIIKTARRLGIRTVAIYSDADASTLHVKMADEAVRLGPAPVTESYLRQDLVIEAARKTGAEAIHPGYGFLSENAAFARAVERAGLVFVGPSADAIEAMGLKDGAKSLMEKAEVPVVPGYHGTKQDPDFLKQKAYEIGYPVLIKAVAGGGGKGMRRVEKAIQFDASLLGAIREAENAFGDPNVLIERYVASPRHIEVQIMGDRQGTVVPLFERDCTLQRRHQKVIEEAPAPGITDGLRARMAQAAVDAGQAVGYVGAGTVEFIVDGSKPVSDNTDFFFMEMNTRLQVEHPVTELITGLDLVELQFKIAYGEPLPEILSSLALRGHAVEARLYAEDPFEEFLPATGMLKRLDFPIAEGIRVDTGVAECDQVLPYYDPMIAKIIAHGPTRKAALDRLASALEQTIVGGVQTNLPLLIAAAQSEAFHAFKIDTTTLDREPHGFLPEMEPLLRSLAPTVARKFADSDRERIQREKLARDGALDPVWDRSDGWCLGAPQSRSVTISTADETYNVDPSDVDANSELVIIEETAYALSLLVKGRAVTFSKGRRKEMAGEQEQAAGIISPMHGKLIAVLAGLGDTVNKGTPIAIVEAMKMEHTILAGTSGTVGALRFEIGSQVEKGAWITEIVTDDSA